MRWDNPIANGWFPRLSPDGNFCIFGAGEVFISEVKVDAIPQSLGPGFAGAWLNAQWAIFSADGDKKSLAVYNPYTRERRVVQLNEAEHNDLDAGDDVFVLTVANPGRVVRFVPNLKTNPVTCIPKVLTPTGGLVAKTAGKFVVANYKGVIRRWAEDGTIRDSNIETNLLTINKLGEIGFGYWGEAQYLDLKGNVVNVTCTTWKQESVPVIVNLPNKKWIFTGTEIPMRDDPNDPLTDQMVIGRFDSSGCLVFQRQPPLYLDVVAAGNYFIVAGCTNRGKLVIQNCLINEALQPFPPDTRPEMPQPVVQFELDRRTGIAPLVVNGRLTKKENVRTWRWLLNGDIHKPVEGNTHQFELSTNGLYTIDVRAQGILADDEHLPGSGGQQTYAGVQEVIVGSNQFKEGFDGCHTGFGECIIGNDNAYQELLIRKWKAARVEAAHDSDPQKTFNIVKEVLDNQLRPMCICRTLTDLESVPEYIDVEWQNEPNGNVAPGRYWPPEEYAASLSKVVEICRRRNLRLWVGSINNISRDGLSYLSKIIAAVPFDIGISVHRYPEKNLRFESAHAGFKSRQDEIDQLKKIISNRRWCVTEFGYTQKPRRSCFRTVPGLTNSEVLDRINKEMQLFRSNGASCAIWFQVWESEPDSGLMDVNRKWKEPQSWRP